MTSAATDDDAADEDVTLKDYEIDPNVAERLELSSNPSFTSTRGGRIRLYFGSQKSFTLDELF